MFRFVRSCSSLFYFFPVSQPPSFNLPCFFLFLAHALFLSHCSHTHTHTHFHHQQQQIDQLLSALLFCIRKSLACRSFSFWQIKYMCVHAYVCVCAYYVRYSHGNHNIFSDFKINLVNTIRPHAYHFVYLWYRFSRLYVHSSCSRCRRDMATRDTRRRRSKKMTWT